MQTELKELRTEFDGTGEMKGYHFKQLMKSDTMYLYELTSTDCDIPTTHWEVFERVVNTYYNVVSYPKAKSFGVWAKCCMCYDKALEWFNRGSIRDKREVTEEVFS